MSKRTLFLGLGNVLCGDDGLGVAAIHRLRRAFVIPPDLELVDGGTLGLALLSHVVEADEVVLLDAVGADAPAGELVRLEGDEVAPAVEARLSPHQIGVVDLLHGSHWLDAFPRRLVLLGLVPETIGLGLGFSAAVERHLPDLVRSAVNEAGRLGHHLLPRTHDTNPVARSHGDPVAALGL